MTVKEIARDTIDGGSLLHRNKRISIVVQNSNHCGSPGVQASSCASRFTLAIATPTLEIQVAYLDATFVQQTRISASSALAC